MTTTTTMTTTLSRRVYDDYERAAKHFKDLDSWGVDCTSLDERLETARTFVAWKFPEARGGAT